MSTMTDVDLGAVGKLFTRHTGRPADIETLRAWIDVAPSAVARRGESLVGYAVCKPFAPDIVELAALLVQPGEWAHGIGTALVGAIEADARTRSLAAVVVVTSSAYETLEPSGSAQPFYERLGYELLLETSVTSVLGRALRADS